MNKLDQERKAFEPLMLSYNHKGKWCWLSDRFCQKGLCKECQIYVDWKGSELILLEGVEK